MTVILPDAQRLRQRNARARRLLHGWLMDESGYDEATWPDLKEALEANRAGHRKLFRG